MLHSQEQTILLTGIAVCRPQFDVALLTLKSESRKSSGNACKVSGQKFCETRVSLSNVLTSGLLSFSSFRNWYTTAPWVSCLTRRGSTQILRHAILELAGMKCSKRRIKTHSDTKQPIQDSCFGLHVSSYHSQNTRNDQSSLFELKLGTADVGELGHGMQKYACIIVL